eukprot:COSAG01_NODE_18500_length_1072_cov_0.787256_2_plen_199_part_01
MFRNASGIQCMGLRDMSQHGGKDAAACAAVCCNDHSCDVWNYGVRESPLVGLKTPAWSYITCDHCGGGAPSAQSVNATFSSLVISRHDHGMITVDRRLTGDGAVVHGSCSCADKSEADVEAEAIKVGAAWSCDGSSSGRAFIDLRGTGYAFDRTRIKCVIPNDGQAGFQSKGECFFSNHDQTVTIHGGGFCGEATLDPL